MRQGKLSELIHNSARYPDLDDCSVEVHFREIIDLVQIFPLDLLVYFLTHPVAWSRRIQGGTKLPTGRGADSIQEQFEQVYNKCTCQQLHGGTGSPQRSGYRSRP